jgi:hypothetical protein
MKHISCFHKYYLHLMCAEQQEKLSTIGSTSELSESPRVPFHALFYSGKPSYTIDIINPSIAMDREF